MKGQHKKEFAWFLNSSSTPLTSINAKRAAKQIVNATRRGQALLIITWQAEILARLHGALPELVTEINGLVNRVLPDPAGAEGDRTRAGHDLESAATRHPLTVSNRIAARQLNERHG